MDLINIAAGVAANQIIELFKGPKEHIAAILSVPILQYRLKQDIKTLQKAQELVKAHGISVKALNLKVLTPLLENAILEDEPVLQNLWANLIVNTIDSSKNYSSTIFINILKEITAQEAELLLYLNNVQKASNEQVFKRFPELQSFMAINLRRLGLLEIQDGPDWGEPIILDGSGAFDPPIEREEKTKRDYLFGDKTFHKDYNQYLSPLGKEFLNAVMITGE